MRPLLLGGEVHFQGSANRLEDESVEDYRARLMTVETGAAGVRQVGTSEFRVQRSGEQVIASVRQGGIMLNTESSDLMLEALETHNHQVELRGGKAVRWNTVERPDPAWAWTTTID